MIIWIQLPELPIKYYDPKVIDNIVTLVGTPIKVDTQTGHFDRAIYAHVCIDIDIRKPLPPRMKIRMIVQKVNYELKSLFCFNCDCLGHLVVYCKNSMKACEK